MRRDRVRELAAVHVAVGGRAEPAAPPEPALVYDPPADLPAPEAVHATSGQYREIPLRWDPVLVPGVAGYVVEGAVSAAGPYRVRATLRDRGVLAWVDRGEPDEPLGDGAERFYRVRAFAHDGRVSSTVSPVVSGDERAAARHRPTACAHGAASRARSRSPGIRRPIRSSRATPSSAAPIRTARSR